ncbi:DUF4381 family protein [Vibrio tapetis subsp. quintayensis]|uniref:DUF4381 family protein n=1 Tax=Vibrio tapetis TaxID=52443 RepID=UPI0025B50557|nr:DUF4381 family protein [Vibrio tapetis]MDN3683025.1 DUF4381 family protein [Vibrio tapetis subsp. quintayensis]
MTEHRAPSTYILRDLNDVEVPPEISWIPQTIGWKVLAAALLVLVVYSGFKIARNRWENRYRGEAIEALLNMHIMTDDAGYRVFVILKQVLFYLDANHAQLHGSEFLKQLDGMLPSTHKKTSTRSRSNFDGGSTSFHSNLGERWMNSLVNPEEKLSHTELEQIMIQSIEWVKCHQSEVTVR